MNKSIILILILVGILSGCSQRSLHSGSVYGSEEMGSPTYFKKGIILSVRDVVIKGTESGVGVAAGAATGGLAGSTLGGNTVPGHWEVLGVRSLVELSAIRLKIS
tara:strand:- start:42 stop:356 length:315 start_codon:yes stop_codon:yes gene_type:complete